MLILPPADHGLLPGRALPLVVAQVRWEAPLQSAAVDRDQLVTVQQSLAEGPQRYETVQSLTSADLIVTPGQAPVSTAGLSGWQLVSDDGRWQATVLPGSASLEAVAFSEFGMFSARLVALLVAAERAFGPAVVTRVGLRFVNLLPAPQSTDGDHWPWTRCLQPALTAPLADASVSAGVVGLEQRMLLSTATGVQAAVRSGLQRPADAPGPERFLLDIDSFRTPGRVWDTAQVASEFKGLNDTCVSLFQQLLSEEMLLHLRAEPSEGTPPRSSLEGGRS